MLNVEFKRFSGVITMQLVQQIQQHLELLPNELQTEVLNYVLALEKSHLQTHTMTDQQALQIHEQLMIDYSEAFEKLAQ